jgi:hypothetical protein
MISDLDRFFAELSHGRDGQSLFPAEVSDGSAPIGQSAQNRRRK